MALIEVVMPQMGESITEGTIVKWHKKIGDPVKKDETLLEISTDKVDSEIPSPASGLLAQIVVAEQTTVPVRTVIAYLETGGSVPSEPPAPATPEPSATITAGPPPSGAPVPAGKSIEGKSRFYSPLVLNIAQKEGVTIQELELVPGTGDEGRVTKRDLLAYLQSRKEGAPVSPAPATAAPAAAPSAAPAAPAASPAPPSAGPAAPASTPELAELRKKYPSPAHDLVPMSNVMQKMARHMVDSMHTSPHVAAIHEVDMSGVVRHRAEHAAAFEQNEGFKLTFTPYIIDAVVKALKKYPMINCSVEGGVIVRKNYINIGIAVASDNGLLVPVIKHAEEKSVLGLGRAVHDLAERTRQRKLAPDDIQGGTFTISNYGVFGTIIGTPMISQPQVAILGTGAITKRVAVVNDALAIRAMAYFTLSFDHRVVDGMLGGMFMDAIVKNLESVDSAMKLT
jgi:2-oxoglutarate dehydrogenase E2 component (dihydrolipoamide succinyltransferase)